VRTQNKEEVPLRGILTVEVALCGVLTAQKRPQAKVLKLFKQKPISLLQKFMYLIFDTETTGLPLNYQAAIEKLDNWPRLVQLAWMKFDESGREVQSCNRLIKPEGFTIPAEVVKIHGISQERALAEGVSLEMVLREFAEALLDTDCVVAHNYAFDEKVIGSELLRAGISHRFYQLPYICTMVSSVDFCRLPNKNGKAGYKWPRLSELHIKLFGTDFSEAHNAAVDVRACAKCLFELIRLGVIRGK
jgi:DNA polymerase III subunit epsilon